VPHAKYVLGRAPLLNTLGSTSLD